MTYRPHLRGVVLVALFLMSGAASGCLPASDVHRFYDREYVLYDGNAAASQQTVIAVEASDLEPAAERKQLDAELTGLDRAIRSGLDEDGALARRRAAVEARLIELRDG